MKFCYKKSTSSIKIYEKECDLPQDWNDYLPDHHFLHRKNLKVEELAQHQHVQSLYACTIVQDKIIAQAHFQILRTTNQLLSPNHTGKAAYNAWRLFQNFSQPKILIFGHLFRHDIQTVYTNGLEEFAKFKVLQQMIDFVSKKYHCKATLLKDMPGYTSKFFLNLSSQYMLLRNDITMTLKIDATWQSFKDYEKALKHKYAQRARKVRKSLSNLKIEELDTDQVERLQNKIYELYLEVATNQQIRMGILAPNYLTILKKQYPDDLKIWGFFEGQELVAFASAWDNQCDLDMFYIGFNYQKNQSLQLYFNILFWGVEQGILKQKHKVIFGRTALEAKARLGCNAHYNDTLIGIKSRGVRYLVERVMNQIHQHEGAWEERHPFKVEE